MNFFAPTRRQSGMAFDYVEENSHYYFLLFSISLPNGSRFFSVMTYSQVGAFACCVLPLGGN